MRTIYGGTFITMDTATGDFTTIGGTADLTGLAYDYTTATMYGVDFGGNLYTIDLETGASTTVGNTGGCTDRLCLRQRGNALRGGYRQRRVRVDRQDHGDVHDDIEPAL